MNKLMSAPRDPPEWGVGVGCVGSDHGLNGPKRIALSVSIRVICVRCLIAAYPMVNGPCSMFNDQNGRKGTLIKCLNQKIMLKNVRGG